MVKDLIRPQDWLKGIIYLDDSHADDVQVLGEVGKPSEFDPRPVLCAGPDKKSQLSLVQELVFLGQ